MNLPSVSCICPTFNRIDKLEEMLYSFLAQDYKGEMELIIGNDCPKQKLIFNHPKVKIINYDKQYTSLCLKHGDIVKESKGDLITVWDDDDIKLPNAISYQVAKMMEHKTPLYYPENTFDLYDNHLPRVHNFSHFHLNGIWTRHLYDAVGGYSDNIEYADHCLSEKFKKWFPDFKAYPMPIADTYAIYRISTDVKQISYSNNNHPSEHEEAVKYREMILDRAVAGTFYLTPVWHNNYMQIVKDIITANKYVRDIYYVLYNWNQNKVTVYGGVVKAYVKFLNRDNGRCDYSFPIERTVDDITTNWGCANKVDCGHRIEIWVDSKLRYAYNTSYLDANRGTFEIKPLSYSLLKLEEDFFDLTGKICAEVGVWRGEWAEEINKCNPKELYLIDYWNYQPKDVYDEAYNLTMIDQDDNYNATKERFKGCGNVKMIRKLSTEAAKDFPDEFFDFVYIDANHSYDACLADMIAWYPKVKEGGVLCGHDLSWASVSRAVTYFCEERMIDFLKLSRDSWGIEK